MTDKIAPEKFETHTFSVMINIIDPTTKLPVHAFGPFEVPVVGVKNQPHPINEQIPEQLDRALHEFIHEIVAVDIANPPTIEQGIPLDLAQQICSDVCE